MGESKESMLYACIDDDDDDEAVDQQERKLWIQTSCTTLNKLTLCHILHMVEELGEFIYLHSVHDK